MAKTILGIDGGGTKTLGRLLLLEDWDANEQIETQLQSAKCLAEYQVGACALTNDFELANQHILELIQQIVTQADIDIGNLFICAGLSGGGSQILSQRLRDRLCTQLDIDNHQLLITSDGYTSAVGAAFGQPVVCIALGTGSVATRLNANGQCQQLGGWGFTIGDEGGAAALGKRAVREVLWEWDQVKLDPNFEPSCLSKTIHNQIGTDEEAILAWLREANATLYGSLAPIVAELADSCSLAHAVWQAHITDVEQLIEAALVYTDMPVVITGGLSQATLPCLSDSTRSRLQPAKGAALDGACYLALTHLAEYEEDANIAPADFKETKVRAAHCLPVKAQFTQEQQLVQQLDTMVSESRNPLSMQIDQSSTTEILQIINQEDHRVAPAVCKAIPKMTQVVDCIVDAFAQGGRLIYLGAGTSGRLGILDAVECPPTYSVDPEQVVGLIAGRSDAIYKAVEGAEDNPELAVQDLVSLGFSNKDVLVGIAASGRTPYVLGGIEYAKSLGAKTAGISCNPDAILLQEADIAICAEVGAEVLTGSTRMKSGTAQKLILNMLTTTAMIRSGKCYENLMVDVHASNEKLVARASRIVMQATGCSHQQAKSVLEYANYSAKLAILMQLTQVSAQQGQSCLNQHNGRLNDAIKALRG